MSRRIKRFHDGNRMLFVGARAELPHALNASLVQDASHFRSLLRTYVDTSAEIADLVALADEGAASTRADRSLGAAIDVAVRLFESRRIAALEVVETPDEPELDPDRDGRADPDLTEKLERVASYLPRYLEGDDWQKAISDGLLNPVAIAMTLAFLVLAFSSGIGAAIVIGIGWALLGWGVFDFVRKFASFVSDFLEADSEREYEACAEKLADALKQFAVDAILALLTRGAGRAARRVQRGGIRGSSGSGSSNRARANEARTNQRRQQQRRSEDSGPSNRTDRPDPNDVNDMRPGGGGHKARRWQEYQERGGEWDYDRWSRTYDNNMVRASDAHRAVDDYHSRIGGWGEREVTVRVPGTDEVRRLDIADVAAQRGIEHKTGYATYNEAIRSEVARDARLVEDGWDIHWQFDDRASQPLLDALNDAGITHSVGTP